MNNDIIVDKINIKDLPDMICTYLRNNKIKKYNNLRSFYSILLDEISEDIKNSYLNRILKYLSSETAIKINILDDLAEGIYDKELKNFCKKLVKEINNTEDYESLYESINRCIIFIFYKDEEEYCHIKTFHNNQDYENLLYSLLIHAFEEYKINLPGIQAKRLLNEALSLTKSFDNRNRMLGASAKLGNKLAINLYSDFLYKTDVDQSVLMLLNNIDDEQTLWKTAFEIEFNSLKKETINIVKQKLSLLDLEDSFLKDITVTEKGKNYYYDMNLLYAFKIYNYIVKTYGFSKAYNSIGKLLIFDFLSYKNDRTKTIELAKKYLSTAMKMGNISAMTNISIYSINNNYNDKQYNRNTVKNLLQVSAKLGDAQANAYYGKLLFEDGKYEEGLEFLEFASDKENREASFELAKYYELKEEYLTSISYYKKSITQKKYDAAYYLALLYLNLNTINSEITYSKEKAIDYLEQYLDKFSEKIKPYAQEILNKNRKF